MSKPRVLAWCVAAAVLLIGAAGVESCLSPGASTEVGRVGTATCLACHDGRSGPDVREWRESPHKGIDCEDCHGPGLAHVRAGGRNGILIDNPADQPFTELPNLCARCHQDAVSGYEATVHFAGQEASCADCHNVHKSGAMTFSTPNRTRLDLAGFNRLCGDCHEGETEQFLKSGHAMKDAATCGSCHDPHQARTLTAMPETNQLCLQCHGGSRLGFVDDAAVDFHTGNFHPVDPDGTGASRCTACHLPPLERTDQHDGPRDHTLFTIPPAVSNEAIAAGEVPSPNSCSGIMGCHDNVDPGPDEYFDVDDPEVNAALQNLYEQIGGLPE